MSNQEYDEEEVISLRRELLETKHRLYLLETSRPIKLASFIMQFLKNPLKGVVRIKDFFAAFKRVDVPKPNLNQILTSAQSAPLPIRSNNPLLRYPNIKVGCLGCIDEFASVCHAFELGDANWLNLLERDIDFLAMEDASFAEIRNANEWLKRSLDKGIPLVVIKTLEGNLAKPLQKADLVLDRTESGSKHTDMPFVDIFQHNPINWQREPVATVGYVGGGVAPEIKGLAVEKVEDTTKSKPYAAVIASNAATGSFAETSKLLHLSAEGIPVLVYGEKSTVWPFEAVKTLDDAARRSKELYENTEKREQASILQRRQTVLSHSQLQHLEFILDKLHIERRQPEKISAIVSSMRPQDVPNAIQNFAKQSYANKELVLLLHGDGFDRKKIEAEIKKHNISYKLIEKPKDSIFGSNLNEAVDAATGDYVTKMDDDDYYGENHFLDLVAAYRYSRADMVGQWANWVYIKKKDITTTWIIAHQETYTQHLPGGTFLTSREFLRKSRFGVVKRAIDSELYRRVEARGGTLYSTHRYNYVRVRHGEHTYTASDEEFMARCTDPTFKGFDKHRTTV